MFNPDNLYNCGTTKNKNIKYHSVPCNKFIFNDSTSKQDKLKFALGKFVYVELIH